MAQNELYHWGIKGQRWGIRRYRNEDGTLTEAGKQRYSKQLERISTRRNLSGSRRTSTLERARKKNIEEMSNQELQEYINRMNLERNYRNLTKRDLMQGNKIAKNILAYYGSTLALITAYNKISKSIGNPFDFGAPGMIIPKK